VLLLLLLLPKGGVMLLLLLPLPMKHVSFLRIIVQ